LDAVVGQQKDPEGPQSDEGVAVYLRQPVSAQVHQPGPVGDVLRDAAQLSGLAVHQIRGREAVAAVGTWRDGRGGVEQQQQQQQMNGHCARHRDGAEWHFEEKFLQGRWK